MPISLSYNVSALLIILPLGGAVVILDLDFRLQRAERLIAANHNFIARLQAFCDFDVGDARDAGFYRPEDRLFGVYHEDALDFVLFRIAGRRWRRRQRHT